MKKMSENQQLESFSVDDYFEFLGELRIANHKNNKEMDRLFETALLKAQEYRNRWLQSEAKVEALKNIIAKQFQENLTLHKRLEEAMKKQQLAEAKAQASETKFNRMYSRVKSVILDTAADKDANAWNKQQNSLCHNDAKWIMWLHSCCIVIV